MVSMAITAANMIRGAGSEWSGNGRGLKCFSFSLVFLAVAWTHLPARNRFFAGDQLFYFTELDGDRSLTKGLSFWDYNTSRKYWKGDQLLCRPLLFVLLAVENTVFGTYPLGWNIVNVLLHAATACALLQLLWFIQPGFSATVFTLFFTVNHAIIELVLWNHLGGYCLSALFILLALYSVLRCADHDDLRGQFVWSAIFAVTASLAAMSYEMGVLMAIVGLVAICAWAPLVHGKRIALPRMVACIPICGYMIGYAFHTMNLVHSVTVRPSIPPRPVFSVLIQAMRCVFSWLLEVIDPWRSTFASMSPYEKLESTANRDNSYLSICTVAFLVVASVVLLKLSGFGIHSYWKRWRLAVCVAVLLAGYVLLTNGGRDYAERVVYYMYFFCLLLVILIYAGLDASRGSLWGRRCGATMLLALTISHAFVSRETSLAIQRQHAPVNEYFDQVQRVIREHSHEKDFTFVADGVPDSIDPPKLLLRGFPESPDSQEVRRVSGIVFPEYFSSQPKYAFYLTAGGLQGERLAPVSP